MEILNNYQRKKLDESNDQEFYSDPKFVYHLDANFRKHLSDIYENEIANDSVKIDRDQPIVKGDNIKTIEETTNNFFE